MKSRSSCLPVLGMVLTTMLLAGCGGDSGGPAAPPPPGPTATIVVSPNGGTIAVGGSLQLQALLNDASGATTNRPVTWTSSNTSIASVTQSGLVTGVGAGTATITATSDGKSASASITVTPPPVAAVQVAPPTASILVGGVVQLSAVLRDAAGNTLTGRTISWSSNNTGVATVDNSGLVRGTGAGTANITATSEGQSGTTVVTVTAAPVATVTIAPPSGSIAVAGTIQLSAVLKDAGGNTLTGRTVNWSSSNAAVATVDNTGLVRGVGAGTANITATSEGVNGTAPITVVGGTTGGPVITSISPQPIVEGGSATIQGTGFGETISANQVTLDGVNATVIIASATSLTITVPSTGCRPTRAVDLRITVNGGAGVVTARPTVRPASFLDVAVGQQSVLTTSGTVCLQFNSSSSSESYLIGVQSVSETPSSLTPIQVTGVIPATTTTTTGNTSLPLSFAVPAAEPLSEAVLQRSARWRRHRIAEAQENERGLKNLRPRDIASASPSDLMVQSARIPSTVRPGDTVTVKVPTVGNSSCSAFTTIRAVVRVNGARGIWIEDVANPAGGFATADFQSLSDVFDNDIYTTDTEYFGVPSDLDQNGRVVIVVTRELNRVGNILGVVFSADLVSTGCPSSNVGEFYYSVAPDPTGQFALRVYTLADARADAPLLIAHEFTHIIQFSRRRAAPGFTAFQSVWELEGQATLAEEVNGHRLTSRSTGQNYGFDVAFNNPPTTDTDWYTEIFFLLARYYGYSSPNLNVGNAPESCTWLGQSDTGPCIDGDALVYGVAASFLRWLSDQFGPTFPGGEKAMHRAFVDNTQTGFATISQVIGRPIDELLTQWAAMLYVDDRVAGAAPRLTMSSWNLAGIWSRLVDTAKLAPRERGFAAFSDATNVRAGSAAYFRVSGASHPATAIVVTGQGNAALPAIMRVWVVRLQ